MSDVFSAGDNLGDSSFLAPSDSAAPSGGADIFSNTGDTSGLFAVPAGSTFNFPSLSSITPPQNLPAPTGSGVSGALGDLSKLVTSFYAGVTQATMAKSAADLAQARAANALQTVKTTPNVWLVAGVAAAGFFALEMMDRGK